MEKFVSFDINEATLEGINPIEDFKGGKFSQFFLPDEFSEIDLFCLLTTKFGEPNGIMSLALHFQGDPNAPFKWDFIFKSPQNQIIQIIRSVKSLEFRVATKNVGEKDVLQFLEDNLKKYKRNIFETKQKLKNYILVVNPYDRHKKMADLAEEELNKIIPQKPIEDKNPVTTQEIQDLFIIQHTAYVNDCEREALYSMLLVTESAFSVEAYLNLIHAVLLKEEIKSNNNIFQEVLRKQWKSKIERLPVNCNGIKHKQVDINANEIKLMQKMFDLRNKIAHSYPDVVDMNVGQMWFFKMYPVLTNPVPFHTYQLALNNRLPTKEEALEAKRIADNSIKYLLELIDDTIQEQFSYLAKSSPLAYNKESQSYAIPFSNEIILTVSLLKDDKK